LLFCISGSTFLKNMFKVILLATLSYIVFQERFKVNRWIVSQCTAHVTYFIPVSFISCRTKDI
jgi:exosortase/archaeosortase